LHAAEKAARAAAETALQALQARDVFVRLLAHDLKTPLVSLSWHVQILNELLRAERLKPLQIAKATEGLEIAAAEVVANVDELEELSRSGFGMAVPLQRERVDLVAFVRAVVSRRPSTARNILRFESCAESLAIAADPPRLSRILDNLLDNAFKFSPDGGEVIVSVGREPSGEATWAVVRVRDHGLGIPETDLAHVFEWNRRSSNVRGISGEGLGLTSVRQLVEQHGGQLDVQSRVGVGSTFSIRLPLAPDTERYRPWSEPASAEVRAGQAPTWREHI
jgi:signal transduction histidine kinase